MPLPGSANLQTRSIVREWPLWLLVATVVAFFLRPLTTATFFFRDLYLLYLPKKLLLGLALREGTFPLWDPLAHNGAPFLGNPNHQALYPTNVLFLLLPELTAFNVNIVLQFVLCACGAYVFARLAGLGTAAAFVAGAAYTFCGYTLSTANLTALFALPWIPITLALAQRFVQRGGTIALTAAAISGAMPVFAGAPEAALMTWLTVLVWIVIGLSGRIVTALVIVALSGGISLVQTIPALELIRESGRAEARPFDDFARWSVSPARLGELVVPQFFGRTDALAEADYWGRNREDLGFPYLLSIYFGAPVLLLFLLGACARGEPMERRQRWLLATLAVIAVALALGRYWPILAAIYDALPMLGTFRYPVKALMLGLLPIAVLAGRGASVLQASGRIVTATFAGGFVLVALLLAVQKTSPASFHDFVFDTSLGEEQSNHLSRNLLHASAAALAIVLVTLLRPTLRTRAAAAVVLLDLTAAGWNVNAFASRQLLEEPPPALEQVRAAAEGGRLYRAPEPGPVNVRAPSNDIVWLIWWRIRTFFSYSAARYGIAVTLHPDYDDLAPRRIARLVTLSENAGWDRRLPLTAVAGASAIMTGDALEGWKPVTSIASSDGRPVHLYANPHARRVRFASRAVVADDDGAMRMLQEPFEPDRVVLAEGTASMGCGGRVVSVEAATDRVAAVVEAGCPGYVVFADTWFPGWRATVDGRDVSIRRADYAFSAVAVGAGRHRVEKIYRPQSVLWGAIGSAVSLLAALLLGSRLRPAAAARPRLS
ncbi:MAG TPA: hypothetical protein VFT12_05560 [Thermoanaerobaculia bacterium]|nr:hypothetical protein [Thermoanaerobaculia bacterium]